MRPMSEFDPTKPAMVHDKLSGKDLAWQPEWTIANLGCSKVEV
jgi:hypothetical protein